MRILIIHNPIAGNGDRRLYRSVLSRIEGAGCDLTIRDTDGRGDATRIAKQARRYDRVVAIGGDGTINEVINGLADSPAAPPLAIVPEGTSNVLAAEIGLTRRPAHVANVILNGIGLPIALGRVNGRYFALMAGAGFDAHMVAGVDPSIKKRFGTVAYAASFLRQVRDFAYPEYRVSVDGETRFVGSVIIANASRYAGFWVIAPNADLRRTELQVCCVERPKRWGRAGAAVALFAGQLAEGRGLTIEACSNVTIDGPPGEPVQADGDIVASLPVQINAVQSSLRLVFPQ